MAASRAPAASVSSSSARERAASSCSSFALQLAASLELGRPALLGATRAARRGARDRASRSPPGSGRSPRPSFAARSAAVACSASGRRRLRTSSSRSRARSTWIATRASFSSARWRRSLKRPSPAASSTSERRSDGFAPSTDSTLPCEITERRPPPRPTSESSSTRSIRRTAARFTRYWPSPPRCSRRASETSANGRSGQAPSSLSKISSTSQKSTGLRPSEPAKSTSSGFSARSSCGLSDPVAQRIESEMFDFPEPFGPTTTATPGSRRTSTGSTNDLKPRSLIVFRCTRRRSLPVEPDGQRGLGTGPAAPARRAARAPRAPPPARRPSSSCPARHRPGRRRPAAAAVNVRSCGGPSDVEQRVADRAAAPGELLLELGLVVDLVRERVLDPALERVDDRRRDRLEAVLEVERGERGLEHRREHVPVLGEPRRLVGSPAPGWLASSRSPRPSSGETTAQLARETTCERSLAICPSSKSGKRS